jgi:hypothetical protein
MPTKRRASKKSAPVAARKVEKRKILDELGLNPRLLAAAIMTIIGALLLIFNIAALLFVFVGSVLIYFGLKMFGFEIRI